METRSFTVVSCSASSNKGEYSDVVARQLMQFKQTKMLCLALFSIDKQFAKKSKTEINKLVVLDGCPINCAELIMKQAGITDFIHLNIADFDIKKGVTPVIKEKINSILNFGSSLVGVKMIWQAASMPLEEKDAA